MNKITTPGLLDYDSSDDEIARWKYRELELALTATLKELDDVRGLPVRTTDEQFKKSQVIDRLTTKLMQIKSQRDEVGVNLPNVFEVLYEIHEALSDDESKRIIREKVKKLKDSIT